MQIQWINGTSPDSILSIRRARLRVDCVNLDWCCRARIWLQPRALAPRESRTMLTSPMLSSRPTRLSVCPTLEAAAPCTMAVSQTESMNTTASIYPLYRYILSKEKGYQPIHAGTNLLGDVFRTNLGLANRKGVLVMSLDDVLFGVIVGGVGLCAVYFRDEYMGWRQHRAAEMRKQMSLRELHIARVSRREDAVSIRGVVNVRKVEVQRK